jgi:hypothetical protein
VDYYKRTWAKGSIKGGRSTVSFVTTALVTQTSATVTFNLHTAAFDEISTSGHVTYHGPAATYLMRMDLRRVGSGWRVANLTRSR